MMLRLSLLFLINLFLTVQFAFADITFTNNYWSTTFNCKEQTITSTGTNICDEMDVLERYQCEADSPYKDTLITSSANNSSGGGGRGYRHWLGTDRNNHSSAFSIQFPSNLDEVWVRWYARYQTGFIWGGIYEHKVVYFWGNLQWLYVNMPNQTGSGTPLDTVALVVVGGESVSVNQNGWYTTQGGATGDNNFDCYEVYLKINSQSGVADGIIRYWLNGILVAEDTSVDFLIVGAGTELTRVDIGQNHNVANNGACAYEDFDDIAVATAGYASFVKDTANNDMIGPLGGGSTTQTIGGGIDIKGCQLE